MVQLNERNWNPSAVAWSRQLVSHLVAPGFVCPARGPTAMHSIFYILLFAFSTLFFFASNLHILSLLLIDTHKVLDIPRSDTRRTTPSLHAPLYALSLIGAAWTAVGYALWTALDGAQGKWRGVPALTGLVVVLAVVAPMNVLYRKERRMFTRSVLVSLPPTRFR